VHSSSTNVHFSYTDEQEAFRHEVRRFLEDHAPIGEARRLMETAAGYDPRVWRKLCDELGLAGLTVPESHGGQGFGAVELGIVLQEMGRTLLCAPFFASAVLATGAIQAGASEAHQQALLPGLAAGTTIGTLAFAPPGGGWDVTDVALTATPDAGTHRIDGVASYVLDGETADLIVAIARAPGSAGAEGLTLFAVAGDAAGLTRRRLRTLDATRKLSELSFASVIAEPLGPIGEAAPALRHALDLAAVALANEMVGAAERVLETTVEYAKTRVQFGRPIGSFQAIKHKCADMLLEVELAKSAAQYAAAAASEESDELPAVASLTKALVADAFVHAATESIQIHGGIGFTWEHDCHLYFKRARSSEQLLGDSPWHRERLAHLELDAPGDAA